jgi:hypothetical protein
VCFVPYLVIDDVLAKCEAIDGAEATRFAEGLPTEEVIRKLYKLR